MDTRAEVPESLPGLPTIQAVAREAGVSVGTVSNVFNHASRVTPQTRARVEQAIDRLGYIRNSAARTLVRRRADGVGLIVSDILNTLFVDMARGAQITAQERGLSLLLANAVHTVGSFDSGDAQTDLQDRFLDYFAEARTGGILLASMRDPTVGISRIREHVRPVVVINYDQPHANWCTVLMDNEQVGRLAAEHIVDLGIERAYFMTPPAVLQPIADRRRGINEAAGRAGLELCEISTKGLDFDDGRKAAEHILSAHHSQRLAIIGVTDALALGALQVLRTRPDIQVPQQVAVIGLDGNHRGNGSDWIALTSVELPGYRMGEEAIRLVLDEASLEHRHERVVLPVTLRVGESTVRNVP